MRGNNATVAIGGQNRAVRDDAAITIRRQNRTVRRNDTTVAIGRQNWTMRGNDASVTIGRQHGSVRDWPISTAKQCSTH